MYKSSLRNMKDGSSSSNSPQAKPRLWKILLYVLLDSTNKVLHRVSWCRISWHCYEKEWVLPTIDKFNEWTISQVHDPWNPFFALSLIWKLVLNASPFRNPFRCCSSFIEKMIQMTSSPTPVFERACSLWHSCQIQNLIYSTF